MIGEMSPSAIAAELGQRLKQARLNQNVTQEELAEHVGITRKMVKNAERGQVTLEMFVTIMDGLNLTANLDLFLPEQLVSPIQLAKMQGKRRRRASPSTNKSEQSDKEVSSW
ncbi:TPA: helix-turn-helix transcriptional regulator [Aeromonas hydrophila subsp. hydrophila]|uniref:helix-turn-helix transcriptional regulator n=1 Tax=Aeromonas caviae TaxID=648 RepID=UPI000FEBA4EF|nr:helix-turn-helix transcriptional regulator [Aeromonas caviae]RWT81269.1 transcriptional regulator [Aeromonas caviae]